MITYARAIHIYQNPHNLKETKCDVLISDGVIEHYDFENHRHQKEIKKLIDHRTWIYDDRPKEDGVNWENLCKFYGAQPNFQ